MLPPPGPLSSRQPTGYSLQAANHSSIATYRTRSLTLDLGLRRTFRWIFIIANVRHAILGADFLHHFGLSVDVRQSRLTDTLTHLQVLGISTRTVSDGLTLPCLDLQDPYAAVLAEFPNLLYPRATESHASMTSRITYEPQDRQSLHVPVVCLRIISELRNRNSTTCWI